MSDAQKAHQERVAKRGMKKGIQYSHYCGLELAEISAAIANARDFMKMGDINEAERWMNYALEMNNSLRIKISDLDIVNEMKY